jgi:hypothetical protein
MCSPSTEKGLQRVVKIDPAAYQRHAIHGENRIWAETNCYTDLMVELLHGLGMDPCAMLPYTLAVDFEGDQWTFFKPSHADLDMLYGMDVQELAIWRPVVDHVRDQVAMGRPVLVELDSYYLPDTVGTAYKTAHVKTAVGINEIDVDNLHLGYFHNNGYYTLRGDDFREVFQLAGAPHERVLPPFAEIAKLDPHFIPPHSLVDASLEVLEKHMVRVPRINPFSQFKLKFARDLETLASASMGDFHAYSFANLRQYGACFELAETYLGWLGANGVDGLEIPRASLADIAQSAKAFQFQLARSMARKKPMDLSPLDAMGRQWDAGLSELHRRFG